ncbi:hypothetical protein ACQJ6L_03270 [Helicobacter pylori]|nr:hypothetical protein KVC31_04215 [Helicobacter pylori]
MINYPNLPNSVLEITEQPEVKEITNELLKQLQNALHSNTLFTEQVELSLKGKESKILGWEIDEDLFCAEFRVTLQKCKENEHDK